MKTYHEITEELLERRDQYLAAQKKKRNTLIKAGGLVCVLAAAWLLVFGLGKQNRVDPSIMTATPIGPASAASAQESGDSREGSSTKPAPQPLPADNTDTLPAPQETLPVTTLPGFTPPTAGNDTAPDPSAIPTPPAESTPLEGTTAAPPVTVIWADGASFGVDPASYEPWNGKQVAYTLAQALKEQPDGSVFAIAAFPIVDDQLVIDGKTLAEYEAEAREERMLPEKLAQLTKEGDLLKYGEALVDGTAPIGETWARSLYEERVAFYGELLDIYIQDGVFLEDKLWEAMMTPQPNTAQLAYDAALRRAREQVCRGAAEELAMQGIESRYREADGTLVLFATEKAFAGLTLSDGLEWYFSLAFREAGTPEPA